MRHKKKKTLGLGRDKSRRRMRQLASSLILHERIETTSSTGKLLKSHVEKLITKGKKDTLHSKRQLFATLSDNAARKVYEVLVPKYKDRPGGYTRTIKVGQAKDGTQRVIVEFID